MRKETTPLSRIVLLFLIVSIFLVSNVLASDVAYIYNKNFKIDNNIKALLNDLNLSVDLIQESKIASTDLSKYRFIFVGDERFTNPKNIPIGKYPTVVTNYYHGYDWGLTDNDGISKLGRTEPMSVKINNSLIVQVYNQGVFDSSTVAIPYYYLGNNDKSAEMAKIAGTYSGNGYDLGDVISYAKKGTHLVNGKTTVGNTCFFGIVESEYWTQDARNMFLDCLTFAGSVCSKDSDCPADSESAEYCTGNGVYKNYTDYSCVNKGTVQSRCAASVTVSKVKDCSFGCSNGKCISCYNNSQCGVDGFVDGLFCSNNNVFQNYISFTCNSPGTVNSVCLNQTNALKKLDCGSNQLCTNGQCLNVTCKTNDDCSDGNSNTEDVCLNPGTINSTCSHKVIACNNNVDCGQDGLSSITYCMNGNVYQNSSIYTCNNPGTSNSVCSSINSPQVKQVCSSSQVCSNGQCLNVFCTNDNDCGQNRFLNEMLCQNDNLYDKFVTYKCNNPGTPVSSCSNTTENKMIQDCADKCFNNQCVNITCYNDAQCNDNNPNTEDKCLNAGTPQSSCSHNIVHCSRSIDCGSNGFNGNKYCMNGNSYEDFITWTCNYPGTASSSCTSTKMPILSAYCDFQCIGGECLSCFNNLSCGIDGFTGDKYCKDNDVYQNYQQFSCLNAGTGQSTCSSTSSPKLVKDCNGVCFKGECRNVACNNDNECDDGIISTKDQCNNPATQSAYCSHTQLNCNNDNDCGINGYSGSEFCVSTSVFKNFQTSRCVNPGTSNSYCAVSVVSNLLNNCGDSYCEAYGNNYCKNNNVYHKRTCNNKDCANGQCISTNSVDEELVQICSYGCANGQCINVKCKSNYDCNDNNPKTQDVCTNPGTSSSTCQYNFITCDSNAACGSDGWVDGLFCSNNGAYQNYRTYICNNPGTMQSFCSSSLDPVLKQNCGQGKACSNGQCVNVACSNDNDCNDNNPMTQDTCSNPGTQSAYCGHNPINCNSNSQCGTNGFIDGLFCQNGNVFQNYVTYTCNNAGTTSSTCTSSIAPQLKQSCSNGQICSSGTCINIACSNDAQCNDNNANTQDVCVNPGTGNSACQHNPIACNGNSDCGVNGFIDGLFCQNGNVFQNYRTYTCNNPGTTTASCSNAVNPVLKQTCVSGQTCSNGQCSNVRCNGNSDCNDNNALTIDVCNNPGTAQSSCTNTPIVCNNNNDCGQNAWSGSPFCQSGSNNVFQNFITYTCTNPGTASSTCNAVSSPQLKQTCAQNQICSNGQCSASTCVDNDHDGYDTCSSGTPGDDGKQADCNDNDATVYPGATEICDGKDNDCDGQIDEGTGLCGIGQVCSNGQCVKQCVDQDLDTYDTCAPGESPLDDGKTKDCNDNNFNINPGKTEICNGIDDDCDGLIDENNGNCAQGQTCTNGQCITITCNNDNDCNDNNAHTLDKCNNPGTGSSSCSHTPILCLNNGECGTNGWFGNAVCQNGDSYQNYITYTCNNAGTILSTCSNVTALSLKQDCTGSQICLNGNCVANTCVDNDHDGYDTCSSGTPGDDGKQVDCNDNDATVYPGAPEICDGKDNDCDGLIDENNGNCAQGQICSNGQCANVVCSNNSQCGTNGYVGDPVCQNGDVYQNYRTFTCNNPGTALSSCSNTTSLQLKQDCSASCFDGQCTSIQVCSNSRSGAVTYYGITFTPLSSTIAQDTTNTLTVKLKNNDASAKTITIQKYACRCRQKAGDPANICLNYWPFMTYPGDGTADGWVYNGCQLVNETISFAANEEKTTQVSVTQYQNMACGFFQTDLALVNVNGADVFKPLVSQVADLCVDCPNIACVNDAQCNDNNANTEDKCINPGTTSSYCNHTQICVPSTKSVVTWTNTGGAGSSSLTEIGAYSIVNGNVVKQAYATGSNLRGQSGTININGDVRNMGQYTCYTYSGHSPACYYSDASLNGGVNHVNIASTGANSAQYEWEDSYWHIDFNDLGIALNWVVNTNNCQITCVNDAQCNDNNANTEDKCINPGTTSSYCTNTNICNTCFTPTSLGSTQQTIGLSGEATLQKFLNDNGYSNVNVYTQQTNDQTWKANNNIQLEVTYLGGASSISHKFGYYLNGNTGAITWLFNDNSAAWGSKYYINVPKDAIVGFVADGTFGLVYTEKAKNSDSFNHFVTYDLCSSNFLIGLEDLYAGGDKDFQDLIVRVKTVNCNAQPICSTNAQCNDNNPNTQDVCLNPGTISSSCQNTPCGNPVIFSDDFSTNPNTNGKWTIVRSTGQPNNCMVQDSAGEFILTRAVNSQHCDMIANTPFTTKKWQAEYDFKICGNADGIGVMPYSGGASPFFLWFDIFKNSWTYSNDYDDHHIELNNNADFWQPIQRTSDWRIKDCVWHHATIKYDNGNFKLKLDNDSGYVIDSNVPNPDYSGNLFKIMAGTGDQNADQRIKNFKIYNQEVSVCSA